MIGGSPPNPHPRPLSNRASGSTAAAGSLAISGTLYTTYTDERRETRTRQQSSMLQTSTNISMIMKRRRSILAAATLLVGEKCTSYVPPVTSRLGLSFVKLNRGVKRIRRYVLLLLLEGDWRQEGAGGWKAGSRAEAIMHCSESFRCTTLCC